MSLLPLEILLALHIAAALALLIGYLERKEDEEAAKVPNPKTSENASSECE